MSTSIRDSIALSAETQLRNSAYPALRRIRCECRDGSTLILHGVVPTYFLKQYAMKVVFQVDEVERIENRIRVSPSR